MNFCKFCKFLLKINHLGQILCSLLNSLPPIALVSGEACGYFVLGRLKNVVNIILDIFITEHDLVSVAAGPDSANFLQILQILGGLFGTQWSDFNQLQLRAQWELPYKTGYWENLRVQGNCFKVVSRRSAQACWLIGTLKEKNPDFSVNFCKFQQIYIHANFQIRARGKFFSSKFPKYYPYLAPCQI